MQLKGNRFQFSQSYPREYLVRAKVLGGSVRAKVSTCSVRVHKGNRSVNSIDHSANKYKQYLRRHARKLPPKYSDAHSVALGSSTQLSRELTQTNRNCQNTKTQKLKCSSRSVSSVFTTKQLFGHPQQRKLNWAYWGDDCPLQER